MGPLAATNRTTRSALDGLTSVAFILPTLFLWIIELIYMHWYTYIANADKVPEAFQKPFPLKAELIIRMLEFPSLSF